MELHALRLGDIASATNEFELYNDYGAQMKARSPGTYPPTECAAKHGGYGAVIQSRQIGPSGGQVLVERTVEALQGMWEIQ
jgi:hypothetical protein